MAIFIVEYLHLTEKIPIIPLENYFHSRDKNPTDSSVTSLGTETSRMHLKISLPEVQTKGKESSPSYIGVESRRVSNEVDYTTTIYPKPNPDERNNIGNS